MASEHDATAATVEATNVALEQIGGGGNLDAGPAEDTAAAIAATASPTVEALRAEASRVLRQRPDLDAIARSHGDAFVGVTSDTGQAVIWGEESNGVRPMLLLPASVG